MVTALAEAPIVSSRSLAPYPRATLLSFFEYTAHTRPRDPALLFEGAHVSYQELARQSDAFAAALSELGVRRGDRVALMLPNCPHFLVAEFGAWKVGAVVSPVNPLYTGGELDKLLSISKPALVVTLSPFYEKLKPLRHRIGLGRIVVAEVKQYLPRVKRVLFTLFREKRDGHRVALEVPRDVRFAELLEQYDGAPVPAHGADPEDAALLLFTGGTTGVPKAAIGTHAGLVATGLQLRHWFAPGLEDGPQIFLQLMPLFHVYGNAGVCATALVSGNPLALVPNPRDLDRLLDTINRVKPVFVPGVPTLFAALAEHPRVRAGKVDFKSIRLCICGAAPLLEETRRRFVDLTGGRMVEGYGLTESMMAAIVEPVNGPHKPGSIGLPMPDVELKVVDQESGAELGPNQTGELLLRGPQVMRGYLDEPEATAAILTDGWLHTGDIAYRDEEGFVFLVDRAKDVIKPSGFQVWPREVEEVLATHPSVIESAVVGFPDPYQGESVKAFVVLRPGEVVDPAELRAFCRERLAPYKVPASFEFRGGLPKSPIGKILRRELRSN